MQTRLFKIFKKSSETEPFRLYTSKLNILGDMSKNDSALRTEYYETIRRENMHGARQFSLTPSLLLLLTEDIINDEDKVLLNYSIDDPEDKVASVVNSYVRHQYHKVVPNYKLIFTLYNASKDDTTWYRCQYLQHVNDRYYQISLRTTGVIAFTVLDEFTTTDEENMLAITKQLTSCLETIY